MDEARSLAPRRVEVKFAPQRMSGEILALAFQLLTCQEDVRLSSCGGVQTQRQQGCFEARKIREVTR